MSAENLRMPGPTTVSRDVKPKMRFFKPTLKTLLPSALLIVFAVLRDEAKDEIFQAHIEDPAAVRAPHCLCGVAGSDTSLHLLHAFGRTVNAVDSPARLGLPR